MPEKEEVFHDQWAGSINIDDVMVDECFESCVAPENRWILEKLGDIRGKRILELGCGAGEASVYFAKKGARVTATDISSGMLEVVQKLAAKHHVTVEVQKAASDRIDFDNESFDIVYAANLLHHVAIGQALSEAARVLKKGGCFVSWDPLAYNPLINAYRALAHKVRTPGEHPLVMDDLKLFKKYFSRVEIRMTWFFTLWVFIKFFLFDRVDPNKERYWKRIFTQHQKLEKTYGRLERMDHVFLKWFPFMKRYCWNIVIFGYK